jgi:hypothetical protein
VENFNENLKPTENDETSATVEIEDSAKLIKLDDLNIKRICKGRCAVCVSEYVSEIHAMRKGGVQFQSIINAMQEKHGVVFSMSSLSRHFSNLLDRQLEVSAQIINSDLISEATAKSVHTQKTVELLDIAFSTLIARAKANSLIFDIADLERLMKMRYQILTGNDDLDKDIMGIFQKATDKYGINLEQGFLFAKQNQLVPRSD